MDIRVYGNVQGVSFRIAVKERAETLGIRGFVRNDPDGTVYIEAEGTPEAIAEFIGWCHKGPPLAEVETVEAIEGAWVGFEEFKKVRNIFQ